MAELLQWPIPPQLTWLGIFICITQSAVFSGLNLACFSVSRLRLEIEVANGNEAARKVLKLREDSNLLLATVLWGNVAINVLLTILANSVMVGVMSFLFSTVVITICGEILPQAYFSRNALRMASLLSPVLRFYQVLLYVVTRPTALLLDAWLGKESIHFMRERDLRQLIHKHIDDGGTDLGAVEGQGALNFLAIDDVRVVEEGEALAPESVIPMPVDADGRAVLPRTLAVDDPLVRRIREVRHRWIIFTDAAGAPQWALDGHGYLRMLAEDTEQQLQLPDHCHRPVVVTEPDTRLGDVIALFKVGASAQSDAPFPHRILLVWGEQRRIITASDILGRLFKGIGVYSALP